MKKGVIAIILGLILIIVLCFADIILLNNKITEISQKSDTNNSVTKGDLFNNNSTVQQNSAVEEPKTTDVKFTQTYTVKANLQEEDATGEYYFYVVDKFQAFDPLVIKVEKKYTLEVNKSYEFTFEGTKVEGKNYSTSDIFDTFTIVDIKKTDKVGLDQIQDGV